MDMLCEFCGELSQCAPVRLINGESACLCAFCENQVNEQIDDSWLPEDDDHCAVSQPGQPAQRSPREV